MLTHLANEFQVPMQLPGFDGGLERLQGFGEPLTPNPPVCGETTPTIRVPELCEKLREIEAVQLVQDEVETPREFARGSAKLLYRQFSPAELTPPEACTATLGVQLSLELDRQYTPANLGSLPGFTPQARTPPPAREQQVVSVGTIGHPTACAEACKYRKRKGGCLLGANCTKCHLCHWRSQRAEAGGPARGEPPAPGAFEAPAAPPPPPPHEVPRKPMPSADQPAYVSLGSLSALGALEAAISATAAPVPPGYVGSEACPTVGSFGHPHACSWPCKYNTKLRGCKQGPSCERCHLCRWTRSQEHAKQAQEARGFAPGRV